MAITADTIAESIPTPRELAVPAARPHWIDDWRPEDPAFWAQTGEHIARRNLVFSILSEHIGFCVWSLWSVFVLFLGPEYGFDPAQKFLLTTVPAAAGAAIRIPYTLAVARFGGRNWNLVASRIRTACHASFDRLRSTVRAPLVQMCCTGRNLRGRVTKSRFQRHVLV